MSTRAGTGYREKRKRRTAEKWDHFGAGGGKSTLLPLENDTSSAEANGFGPVGAPDVANMFSDVARRFVSRWGKSGARPDKLPITKKVASFYHRTQKPHAGQKGKTCSLFSHSYSLLRSKVPSDVQVERDSRFASFSNFRGTGLSILHACGA